VLDGAVQTRLRATVQEVAEDLVDYDDVMPEPEQSLAARVLPESIRLEPRESEPKPKIALAPHVTPDALPPEWHNTPVHCIAGRTDLDETAAAVLATLLAKHGVGAKASSWRAVSGGGLAQADAESVRILCLSSLSSQVSSHLKFLIRRLRRRYPAARVVVGFWSLRDAAALPAERVAEIGADSAVYSLREALMVICQRALDASERRPAPAADLG
jgi:hypothetical protein